MRPPRLAETLLTVLLPEGYRGDSVRGDLFEEYTERARKSRRRAAIWYWVEALRVGFRYVGSRRVPVFNGPGRPTPGSRLDRASRTSWMRDLAFDIRFGFRGMKREPGWSLATLGTLGLAIGATSGIFAVVYGILLRPLPYPDPGRLVSLEFTPSSQATLEEASSWDDRMRRHYRRSITFPAYESLARGVVRTRRGPGAGNDHRPFWGLGAFDATWSYDVSLGEEGGTQRLGGVLASASLFQVLGIPPLVGRWTSEEEDQPDTRGAVLLSYRLWQDRLGSRRDLDGVQATVNGIPYTVVGVMPPNFGFPSETVDLWISLSHASRGLGSTNYEVVGRVVPGPDERQVDGALASQRVGLIRTGGPDWEMRPSVTPLQSSLVGEVRPALALLFCAVSTLLLIACVNVMNLALTRATRKEQEHGLRAALGAGPGRLARLLLTESVLVSILGAVLGLGLTWIIVNAVPGFAPEAVPRKASVRLDGAVLVFTGAVAVVVGLAVGLVPALHAVRLRSGTRLIPGFRWSSWGSVERRLRDGLVVVQLGLALVLLVSGSLLIRSFAALLNEETGFDPVSVLTFETSLPGDEYAEASARRAFYQELNDRVLSLPGVREAGMTIYLPAGGQFHWGDIEMEGHSPAPGQEVRVEQKEVTPTYFDVLGMDLLEGRPFRAEWVWSDAKEVVVTESLGRRHLAGESPIGRRINTGEDEWWTVVGVVADVRHRGAERDVPTVFFPYYSYRGGLDVALKVEGDPGVLALPIQRILADMDPDVTLFSLMPLEARLGRAVAGPRFQAFLVGAFGLLSALLSVVGIYGVMAYAVTRRTREMGIRRALGAESSRIVGRVAAHGFRLTLFGVGLGLVGVFLLTGLLEGFLFGVGPHDPTTLILAVSLLSGASLVACLVPAFRAARTDPLLALRSE